MGKKAGGTTTCTYDLVNALNANACPTDILTVCPLPGDELAGNDSFINAVPYDYRTPLCFSANMHRALKNEDDYDLFHTNGMWLDINHATCSLARSKGKPYMITPHGMLYPQALARSSIKKIILKTLWYNKDLHHAACIHATCHEEMNYYRKLGFSNPVAVIPNPVPIPDCVSGMHKKDDVLRIGFLGRLHPRKNVHLLLEAWIKLNQEHGELIIIGEGEQEYMHHLQTLADTSKWNNIHFKGFLSGQSKFEALSSLSALCVPSDFENFGMIVPEALLVGTPVIASHGCPWESLDKYHCGWWVDNSLPSLISTMEQVALLSPAERQIMGNNGRTLVAQQYAANQVAHQMIRVYQWLVDGKDKPDYVFE